MQVTTFSQLKNGCSLAKCIVDMYMYNVKKTQINQLYCFTILSYHIISCRNINLVFSKAVSLKMWIAVVKTLFTVHCIQSEVEVAFLVWSV